MIQPSNETPLSGYRVLLCVTGGIACYKAADLASKLVQAGAGVSVAMTDAAREFITPQTFQALTREPVFVSLWADAKDANPKHISLTERSDLMVIAPATANIIGKIAGGIADDLVSTMVMATGGACDVLIAPAMNSRMWQSPALQANLAKVKSWGMHTVGPADGYLACGTSGPGRLADVKAIFNETKALLLNTKPKNRA